MDRLGLIAAILSWHRLLPVSRIVLVSAYLIGGIQNLTDFNGVVAGLPPTIFGPWKVTTSIALNSFFEHLSLIAGLVLVSVIFLQAQGETLHEASHDLQPSP
jgi:hypothetical protein